MVDSMSIQEKLGDSSIS